MRGCADSEMPWAGIRALMAAVARMTVTPMQDVLGLGTEGRMNTPGTVGGKNWGWRMDGSSLKEERIERLRELTAAFGRLPVA